jgi:hypothetical protein
MDFSMHMLNRWVHTHRSPLVAELPRCVFRGYLCLSQRESIMTLQGPPAVDFELPDANGQTHRLADYAGRWLLMVFHRHLG